MDKFRDLLLEVWRIACRHVEIGESTAAIAKLLTSHMPIKQVYVRHLDTEKSRLETVAAGFKGSEEHIQDIITRFKPEDIPGILAWLAKNRVTRRNFGRESTGMPGLLVPFAHEDDVLVGALSTGGQSIGIIVLAADRSGPFREDHARIVEILLEPFSVALENDHRLRELSMLRKTAEAERERLLMRLGRHSMEDTIVGTKTGLRSVMERIALVAQSDIPVLFLGETGTGKEMVAREIHRHSPRAGGPIVRVNCGAIPGELIDSQLFGHERGAFTGAAEVHRGWFERADGGTLFLDEIGELTLAAQVRLLRVLQDGWMERIGGRQPIKVDVRIIASTNRDLAAMVAEGKFREDLWYRIAAFPIILPPLRDRKEDIPLLAKHFAEKAASRFCLPVLLPTEDDLELLVNYPWPGNVRELGAVMDRAAILGNGKKLEVKKALGVAEVKRAGLPTSQPGPAEGVSDDPLPPLEEVMRMHIERALEKTYGRIDGPFGAARILGINSHTLRARMKKLGVNVKRFRK